MNVDHYPRVVVLLLAGMEDPATIWQLRALREVSGGFGVGGSMRTVSRIELLNF
jgi:nicotinic acid phosphoribosyltransferase